ncbi:MAG: HIT domain-containing protein [Acidobacteria bacterium]|nr:HIT domain-containing protein [Acidobacteriota bacterium]
MDSLFTPWRFRWVTTSKPDAGCLFCRVRALRRDGPANMVLVRARRNFVILNRFPYNNGHLMVVPNEHVDTIAGMSSAQMREMMELAQRCERALRRLYRPEGFNLGMNLGRCAGAGIEGHLHLHLVPRWAGDTNFMSVVDGTRILPEALSATFQKLRRELRRLPNGGTHSGRRAGSTGR